MDIEELCRRKLEIDDRVAKTNSKNKEIDEINKKKDIDIKRTSKKIDQVLFVAHNSEKIIDDLDLQFEQLTGFDSLDIKFLILAVALQCTRQYIFSNEKFRLTDKQGDKMIKGTIKKVVPKDTAAILTQSVPYDAFFKTEAIKQIETEIAGSTHRYRTLGHDPVLGWIFGTFNILTDSLTKYDVISSFKVDGQYITSVYQMGTYGMFNDAINQIKEVPVNLVAAIFRQAVHFGSDFFTKQGLPIPLICTVNNNAAKNMLTNSHIDMYSISRGVFLTEIVNMIVASIHKLFYDEEKYGNKRVYEVKTRKILTVSNLIASTSNVIFVAINGACGNANALNKLDVGGILVTIHRIINDKKFIREIKKEYVYGSFSRLIRCDDEELNQWLSNKYSIYN